MSAVHPVLGSVIVSLTAAALAQGQPPAGRPPAREPMLLPQAVVLPRGTREITIDGSLVDWPELPALQLDDQRQVSGTALDAWHGPQDLSAMAFLMWDSTHLWIACAVKDEWHRPLDANTLLLTEVPAADSVVFTFDPGRDTRGSGADPGRQDDREFWLADESGREVVQWDRLRGTARVLEAAAARMVSSHDKEHGITTHEARIPWREILPAGQQATAGLVLDMQVVVNDFDERTDAMPQTRVGWTFGMGPVVDPGLLGSIMLVADRAALDGRVPEFPPKPGTKLPPAPAAEFWQDLTARLVQRPPVVHDGALAPEEAGGVQRLAVLEAIEEQVAKMPRVDWLEFHHRIHRRMSREVAGIAARGLPSWWRDRLQSVSRMAEDPVPNRSARVFRLPMGGWLVRTTQKNFAIDPAGADLAEWLWGGIEFCILTEPLDLTRRNDQLLVRMLLGKPPRPVLGHIAFHLPAVTMESVPLVEQGQNYGQPTGVQVKALGKKASDGSVTWSCSYLIDVPAGPRLMVVGQNLRPDDVDALPVDVMILTPRNADSLAIVAKVQPRLVLVDEGFRCQSLPTMPRITLRELHAFQRAMQPQRSLLLAPGESWDVTAGQ
jgi:hypothetical protein